jgi:hypothetical protein
MCELSVAMTASAREVCTPIICVLFDMPYFYNAFFDKNKWKSTIYRARMPFDTLCKEGKVFDPRKRFSTHEA